LTRTTCETPGNSLTTDTSFPLRSPTTPKMVVELPLDRCTSKPAFTRNEITLSTACSLASGSITTIMGKTTVPELLPLGGVGSRGSVLSFGSYGPDGPLSPMHSQSSGDPLLGTTVAGRYKIIKLLGEGGMGQVYLAEHFAIEKRVALKVLRAEY